MLQTNKKVNVCVCVWSKWGIKKHSDVLTALVSYFILSLEQFMKI